MKKEVLRSPDTEHVMVAEWEKHTTSQETGVWILCKSILIYHFQTQLMYFFQIDDVWSCWIDTEYINLSRTADWVCSW